MKYNNDEFIFNWSIVFIVSNLSLVFLTWNERNYLSSSIVALTVLRLKRYIFCIQVSYDNLICAICSQLFETKSTDRKLTLLHYIVNVVQSRYADITTFYNELRYVEKAAAGMAGSLIHIWCSIICNWALCITWGWFKVDMDYLWENL